MKNAVSLATSATAVLLAMSYDRYINHMKLCWQQNNFTYMTNLTSKIMFWWLHVLTYN